MDVEQFCVALSPLELAHAEQAIAVLWFLDKSQPGTSRTAGELARLLRESGLAEPHSTRLGKAIQKSGHVLSERGRLRIKPTARVVVEKQVASILVVPPPSVDQSNGFLPEAIWVGTRQYVERVARQINGCYQFGFYDGASVLIRRIVETLLIECYEHLQIDDKIKKNGSYPMLAELIVGAVDQGHLSLSRETAKALREIKTTGDRGAHARRYSATQADLDKIQSGVRVAVEDLILLGDCK